MNKLLLLVAVALLSTVHQASACDMGAITAYVAGTVVASNDCGTCAAATPALPQIPADGCGGNGCVTPTLVAPKLACEGSSCNVVDEPISSEPFTKPTTQEPADCGTANCATPSQRVHVAGCTSSGC